jgi:hypothetical protein
MAMAKSKTGGMLNTSCFWRTWDSVGQNGILYFVSKFSVESARKMAYSC